MLGIAQTTEAVGVNIPTITWHGSITNFYTFNKMITLLRMLTFLSVRRLKDLLLILNSSLMSNWS